MFYLYPLLESGREDKINALIQEFKKIYRIIILSILGIGLAIIPFIRYLINSELDRTELIIYYILYLTNSVASYFVVYRTMILKADQKEYIVNNCNTIFTIIMYIYN